MIDIITLSQRSDRDLELEILYKKQRMGRFERNY